MHTRTTSDYSPLRGPIMDQNGKDISGRSRYERQQYEMAVNARKDMLKLMENSTPKSIKSRPRKTWAQRMSERTGKDFH